MPFQEIEKYKSLGFYARQVVEGYLTGLHHSPFHGFSVEFAEHRLYNPGESTRHIDWKLYGRTDKLFVKRYEEETNLRCHLIVDHSSSMYFPLERQGNMQQPNKLTFSIYAAAVLVELLVRQRDAFGLTLFSDGVDLQTDVRSSGAHQQYLYSLLEQQLLPVKADNLQKRGTRIADTLHIMAEKMHRRSMVVLFSDVFVDPREREPLWDALRHLRHCKHEVLIFHTYDRDKELLLNYGSRPVEFVDLEGSRRVKVFPGEVADRYRDTVESQFAELKHNALMYNIDYIPVDVGEGFDRIMMEYFSKRNRMR